MGRGEGVGARGAPIAVIPPPRANIGLAGDPVIADIAVIGKLTPLTTKDTKEHKGKLAVIGRPEPYH